MQKCSIYLQGPTESLLDYQKIEDYHKEEQLLQSCKLQKIYRVCKSLRIIQGPIPKVKRL